jgi:uncharacterized protein (TIGR02246 family)
MQRTHRLVAVTLLALAACARASAPAATDTAADIAAVNAVREREAAALNSGNIDSALAVYAADVQMMSPNEKVIVGAPALRTWLENFLATATVSARYTSSVVDVSGDLAVDRYTGELTVTPKAAGATTMTEVIKGVHVMRRQADGSWRITQDVWNSDAPPPAPPPAK